MVVPLNSVLGVHPRHTHVSFLPTAVVCIGADRQDLHGTLESFSLLLYLFLGSWKSLSSPAGEGKRWRRGRGRVDGEHNSVRLGLSIHFCYHLHVILHFANHSVDVLYTVLGALPDSRGRRPCRLLRLLLHALNPVLFLPYDLHQVLYLLGVVLPHGDEVVVKLRLVCTFHSLNFQNVYDFVVRLIYILVQSGLFSVEGARSGRPD